MSAAPSPARDDLATQYLDQLPFPPYPVQEEALLSWFSSEEGVLVCAPTGTGKTLIAEAAAFEALHTGSICYYTTPLIALTEQKFQEMQAAAVRWGFAPDDIGLVTGNRRVNPNARVLVVVAEILLNRLLHTEAFDFAGVSSVVMDEFHSFADVERGIVWELSLALLPKHVRLLLLSATVGNAPEFLGWLRESHGRRLQLVQSTDRKVPLLYQWVPDKLLNELIEEMAEGSDETRRTPTLVFCFNREECWTVAEQLKGKSLLADGQQKRLAGELEKHDWSKGAGPKLKQILQRGVGVHHAGLLPKYRRIVEDLFQRKLLTVAVCTETLASGINLPARSVVMPSLLKGKSGEKKVIDPSSAHQIFGRAGRPQFDAQGYIYVLAHEDDVKILRWKEKYDTIPEDTKDPGLIRAKKALKKKMPTRGKTEQYWNEEQFEKLRKAPPGRLLSRGQLPWRLLAHMLQISPDVDLLRTVVRKRLMDPKQLVAGERALDRMLLSLHAGDFVELEPPPPTPEVAQEKPGEPQPAPPPASKPSWFALELKQAYEAEKKTKSPGDAGDQGEEEPNRYRAMLARPTDKLARLLVFRSVNPMYGAFLIEQLGIADRNERLQALESVLELPSSMLRSLRVPPPDRLPPGPLATTRLDTELIQRGLITEADLKPNEEDDQFGFRERRFIPALAEKLRLLFDSEFPDVRDLRTQSVWVAGDLLEFNGQFHKYVSGRDLSKQEGIIFRHLLRLILLCGEFAQLVPPGADPEQWRNELREISDILTAGCREVDPGSTDKMLEDARAADVTEAL